MSAAGTAGSEGEVRRVRVSGPMNYAEAPRRCAGLARPGAGIAELELELSESGPWDLAGLQILLVLDRAMRDAGGRMRLAGVPGVLEREAQRAGLAAWLAGVRQC